MKNPSPKNCLPPTKKSSNLTFSHVRKLKKETFVRSENRNLVKSGYHGVIFYDCSFKINYVNKSSMLCYQPCSIFFKIVLKTMLVNKN